MDVVRSHGGVIARTRGPVFGNDRTPLTANVAEFLQEGLRQGGAALVVACAAQRDALRQTLGTVRVTYLDNDETLMQILGSDDYPTPSASDAVVGTRARRTLERYGRLRAYGEMVSLLWGRRQCEAALQLEALWNGLMQNVPFDLFCGYAIDVLADEFQIATIHSLLDAHSHVASNVEPAFAAAMERTMDELWAANAIRCFQSCIRISAASLPRFRRPNAPILRLRSSLPRYAEASRENAARSLREA